MLKPRTVATAVGVIAIVGLAGCATGSTAPPHQHFRDAKQGATMPYTSTTSAAKPLHDHREMK